MVLHASEWLYFLSGFSRLSSFATGITLSHTLFAIDIGLMHTGCTNWEMWKIFPNCADHTLYHFMLHNDLELHCCVPDRNPLVDFPIHKMAGKHVECPRCECTPTVHDTWIINVRVAAL